MTAITIRLPNSVHQKIKELAARDDVSVNQFIASAASEKNGIRFDARLPQGGGSQGKTQ